jgi:hypothetical protein
LNTGQRDDWKPIIRNFRSDSNALLQRVQSRRRFSPNVATDPIQLSAGQKFG